MDNFQSERLDVTGVIDNVIRTSKEDNICPCVVYDTSYGQQALNWDKDRIFQNLVRKMYPGINEDVDENSESSSPIGCQWFSL